MKFSASTANGWMKGHFSSLVTRYRHPETFEMARRSISIDSAKVFPFELILLDLNGDPPESGSALGHFDMGRFECQLGDVATANFYLREATMKNNGYTHTAFQSSVMPRTWRICSLSSS
jgi:hypothetical protein